MFGAALAVVLVVLLLKYVLLIASGSLPVRAGCSCFPTQRVSGVRGSDVDCTKVTAFTAPLTAQREKHRPIGIGPRTKSEPLAIKITPTHRGGEWVSSLI